MLNNFLVSINVIVYFLNEQNGTILLSFLVNRIGKFRESSL